MGTTEKVKTEDKTLDDYPVLATRVVRHGLFWYHIPELHVVNGKEKLSLVQHTAFNGQSVDLYLTSDVERADKFNALHPEGYDPRGANVVETAGEEEVELADLDHAELVEWLMAAGTFDGEKKPTIPEILDAAKGDPALADRLIEAEKEASGGDPREGAILGLEKISAGAE